MTPPVEPTPPRVALVFLDPRDPELETVRAVIVGRPGAWRLINDPNSAALERAVSAPRVVGDHENGAA